MFIQLYQNVEGFEEGKGVFEFFLDFNISNS